MGTTRLKQLEEKQKQLKAQIQKEKARVSQAERNQDTRRKVLVGAAILSQWSDEQVRSLMDKFLERPNDRKLFGLPVNEADDLGG